MYRLYFFLLPIVCNMVLAQDCVTENFENGIASFRQCLTTHANLVLRKYSALNMISPHPRSTKFITPQSTSIEYSCIMSSNFTITRGGTLEVNRYTSSKNITDTMWVHVRTAAATGIGTGVISAFFSPSQPHFVPGWETFKMIIPGTGTFEGTVLFDGRDPGSMIAIDSYRFVSPTYNKDLCKIYDDPITSTTTTTVPSTTTTTTAVTTTTAAPSTSTQAPRLSISLQKEFKLTIQKFFN